MKRPTWTLLPVLLGAACHHQSSPNNPDLDSVKGEWSLAFFKNQPDLIGNLSIKEDKTFTGKFTGKEPTKDRKTLKIVSHDFSGKCAQSHITIDKQDVLMTDFQITTMDGKNAGTGAGFRLSYDAKNNLLVDILTLVFCRPGDEAKVKEMIESKPKQ